MVLLESPQNATCAEGVPQISSQSLTAEGFLSPTTIHALSVLCLAQLCFTRAFQYNAHQVIPLSHHTSSCAGLDACACLGCFGLLVGEFLVQMCDLEAAGVRLALVLDCWCCIRERQPQQDANLCVCTKSTCLETRRL
jgi:hypothetical protein